MSSPAPRIFIVEDEALIAMELSDRLTRLGYAVTGVSARGEQALEEMAAHPPDVVLMDIRLAGALTGIETAARLREWSDVSVIFLTAYSDPELLQQAGAVEAFGYLVKPFEERELHATIQMALYRRRMERALREANERLEEQVRARTAQLAESEESLAVTLRSIGDAVLATDVHGRVTRMNLAAEQLTGWPLVEAVGRPIADVFRIVDEETHQSAVIPVNDVLATGAVHALSNHTGLIARDGTVRSIADSAAPIRDVAGHIVGVVLVFRDDTEARRRRRLVERQRTMLGALRDVQEQFIGHPDTNAAFDHLLAVLLGWTESEYGFVGEVLRTPEGQPYLKTQAITDISWDKEMRRRYATHAQTGLEFLNLESLYGVVMTDGQTVIANHPATDPRSGSLPTGHPPLHAFLGVPITVSDEVVGMIGVANRDGGYDEPLVAELQPLLATYGSMILARRNDVRRRAAEESLRELNADLEGDLRRRSEALIESERLARATMDALAAQVAVLDEDGVILTTNQAWRHAVQQNGDVWRLVGEGANYLAVCERMAQIEPADAYAEAGRQIAQGIRDVIAQRIPEFMLEHPCHLPDETRWFLCRVTRFPGEGRVRVVVAHEDITSVKLAQQRLVAIERIFESLATTSPVGIFRADAMGACLYVNQRWCDITGLSEQDARGDGWLRALHPDDRDRVFREWTAATSARASFRSDYRFRHLDGQITWVLGQAVAITDVPGDVIGFIGTLTEVTDQKLTEVALRLLSTELVILEGEAFFQGIVQHLAALLECEIAFVARMDVAREGWLQMVAIVEDGRLLDNVSYPSDGTPCAEVWTGRSLVITSDVQRRFPADAFLAERHLEAYAAVPLFNRAGSPMGHLGVMSRSPLGHPALVESILQMFGVSVVAVMERQRSARRFHDLVEFSPDGIVMTDHAGVIALVNQEAERMFGWTREEIVGQSVEMLVPAVNRVGHVVERDRFVRSASSRRMGAGRPNLRAIRKDGTEFPVEVGLSPIETEEGTMVAAAVRDITARRNLERQANRQQRLEALGTLAGSIAHDLNNALTPIVMSVDVLKTVYPEELEILETIEISANRAADMVRQLLSFARGANGQHVSIQPIQLVKEMEKIVRSLLPKNIQVHVRLPEGLPTVSGDATQLHQVLLNLCVNARDAMPDGGALTLEAVVVDVDTVFTSSLHEPEAKPGRYVVLRVLDDGTGIAPEILDRIFDPFFTTRGSDRGSGLGLSTVLGIVKGHDGFIQVSSWPGQGSSFAVYLPAEHGEGAVEIVSRPGPDIRGQGETILFVDDEAAVRDAARGVLVRLGFTPLIATDGTDALIQVARSDNQARAIITDLHMPGMDGVAFVRAVRRLLPDVPVIIASGRLDDHAMTELRRLGVRLTLDKPFTQGKLVEVLRAALQGTEPPST